MMNVDLSSIVSGHMEYANKIDDILLSLGYADEVEETVALRRCLSTHGFKEHREHELYRSESMDSFLVKGGPKSKGFPIMPDFKKT